MLQTLAGIAVGFVSGVLSGLFGIGGGMVTTPAIRLLLGRPEFIAVGTPLPVIIPSAVTAAASYARSGLADVRAGIRLGLWGAFGTVGGALLTRVLGGRVVLVATAVLIVYVSVDMLRPRRPADVDGGSGEVRRLLWWAWALSGLVTGFYSGFFGLGGGFLLVPVLYRLFRFPLKRALGTSLVAVGILAVPGTLTHWALGHIDWALALLLTAGVIPGAWVGARITRFAKESSVRVAFALALAAFGVALAAVELLGVG